MTNSAPCTNEYKCAALVYMPPCCKHHCSVYLLFNQFNVNSVRPNWHLTDKVFAPLCSNIIFSVFWPLVRIPMNLAGKQHSIMVCDRGLKLWIRLALYPQPNPISRTSQSLCSRGSNGIGWPNVSNCPKRLDTELRNVCDLQFFCAFLHIWLLPFHHNLPAQSPKAPKFGRTQKCWLAKRRKHNLGLLTICIQQLLLTLSVQGEEQPIRPILKFFLWPSRMLRTDSSTGQSARFDSEILKMGVWTWPWQNLWLQVTSSLKVPDIRTPTNTVQHLSSLSQALKQ